MIFGDERLPERFWVKARRDGESGCWLWTGAGDRYGRFYLNGRLRLAYQVAYEILVGPVPDGLELDHLCRTTKCVNPGHLEPVTHQENCARADIGAKFRNRTHCPAGHAYDEQNTIVRRDGTRQCRSCKNASAREYKRKRKEAGLCPKCGSKELTNGTCGHCKGIHARWMKARGEGRRLSGLCGRCGKKSERDGWLCQICQDDANRQRRERRAARKDLTGAGRRALEEHDRD